MPFATLMLFALATARSAPLDDAYLVADLDPRTSSTRSSSALVLGGLGGLGQGVALVAATEGETRSLWRSDGTAAGTSRLTTIQNYNPFFLGTAGDRAFLVTFDGQGFVLLATDGTAVGTERLFRGQARLLGALDDGTAILERNGDLWRSDGTLAGTGRLGLGAAPGNAASIGARVVFNGTTRRHGTELWATDGTRDGTVRLTDLVRGPASSSIIEITAAGDRAFFVQATAAGNVLWVTDGTLLGTREVASLPASSSVSILAVPGLDFVLVAAGSLWRSDGTPAGTFRVGPAFSNEYAWPRDPTVVLDGVAYFGFADDTHGYELWRSDGTAAGTRLVRDICPGACGGLEMIGAGDDRLLLVARADDVAGVTSLWSSDGTRSGTRVLRRLCSRFCASPPTLVADPSRHGRAYLTVAEVFGELRLWRTDGTRASTVRLDGPNLQVPQPLTPVLVPTASGVLFGASDSDHGTELWLSDGTAVTTRLAVDLDPQPIGVGSDPHDFARLSTGAVFLAGAGSSAAALWRTSGNEGEVERLADLGPAALGSLACSREVAFYATTAFDIFGNEVWATDGTPARTARVWSGDSYPTVACLGASSALILADRLWRTDGTVAGTYEISDLTTGAAWQSLGLADHVLFAASQEQLPSEKQGLWISDGTSTGTFRLASDPVDPHCLTRVGDEVLFLSAGTTASLGLWVADGSGAQILAPALLEDRSSDCADAAITPVAGDRAYLTLDRHTLAVTDLQHVEVVHDFGDDVRITGLRAALGGVIVFVATTSDIRTTVWFTNGTSAGTFALTARQALLAPGAIAEVEGLAVLALAGGGLIATDGRLPVDMPDLGPVVGLEAVGHQLVATTADGIWTIDASERRAVRRHQHPYSVTGRGELLDLGPRVVFPGMSVEDGWEPWALDLP